MSAGPLIELLNRLAAQGNSMLAAAKAGDWESLAALDAKRAPDMAQLGALAPSLKQGGTSLPPPVQARISAILAVENEMIPLVEQAREETLKELQSLDSSRRLKNLYGSVGNSNSGL